MRRNANCQKEEFLVSWQGYPEEDNTWELGKDLIADGHGGAIEAFLRTLKGVDKNIILQIKNCDCVDHCSCF